MTAWGLPSQQLQEAMTEAFAEFEKTDWLMSNHRPESELNRFNRASADEDFPLSPDLFEVLRTASSISRQTKGAFDVTVQPLTQLWGFIWKEHRFPRTDELASVLPRVGYTHLVLYEERRVARKRRPDLAFDLGGIAKGWAVDRALDRLRAKGVRHAMVKAGGDLRVMGEAPGGGHWIVQLEDPEKGGRRVEVRLRDAALSTSGDYENFFVHEGRRYSHILDPRTGIPVRGVASCTVVAPTCVESDAWATACFVYGVRESLKDFGGRFSIRFMLASEKVEPGSGPGRVMETPGFPYR